MNYPEFQELANDSAGLRLYIRGYASGIMDGLLGSNLPFDEATVGTMVTNAIQRYKERVGNAFPQDKERFDSLIEGEVVAEIKSRFQANVSGQGFL